MGQTDVSVSGAAIEAVYATDTDDPLTALWATARRFELVPDIDAATWQGILYGPDGKTPSMMTAPRDTQHLASVELLEQWRWLLDPTC